MIAHISRPVAEALASLAAASPYAEICGLLTGEQDSVAGFLAAPNVAEDAARRFEIDLATLFAALKGERRGEHKILGCYHSHPGGAPVPSARDAADAEPNGWLWLIVAGGEAGLWRAVAHGAHLGRFQPVAWDVMTPSGLHLGPGFSKRPDEPHIRSLVA